jgi:hypothetical protein
MSTQSKFLSLCQTYTRTELSNYVTGVLKADDVLAKVLRRDGKTRAAKKHLCETIYKVRRGKTHWKAALAGAIIASTGIASTVYYFNKKGEMSSQKRQSPLVNSAKAPKSIKNSGPVSKKVRGEWSAKEISVAFNSLMVKCYDEKAVDTCGDGDCMSRAFAYGYYKSKFARDYNSRERRQRAAKKEENIRVRTFRKRAVKNVCGRKETAKSFMGLKKNDNYNDCGIYNIDQYCDKMATGRCWGTEIELMGLQLEYEKDIFIYRKENHSVDVRLLDEGNSAKISPSSPVYLIYTGNHYEGVNYEDIVDVLKNGVTC